MAGRPRSFDEDIVMSQIMATFWERGFRNTSIDDLMAVTNLSRASLYTAFGDKAAMFLKALDRYVAGPFSPAWEILDDGGDPQKRLTDLVAHWEERLIGSKGRGCLVVQTYIEFAHLSGPIAEGIQAIIRQLRLGVQKTLTDLLPGRRQNEYVRVSDYVVSALFSMHASARARSLPQHIRNIADIHCRVIGALDQVL